MKKKISLLLAVTMLLTGCTATKKAEQTTAEVTTTVTTTTTKVTTTAAKKQTSAPTKETKITQATKDTPNASESEVYLFDYQSLYEIAPSEKEQFKILENVFYGEWKNDASEMFDENGLFIKEIIKA